MFAGGLPFDDPTVVGAAPIGIGENFESLGDQGEQRSSFGVSGVEVRVILARSALVGATELRRREPTIDSEDRIEIGHDLSVSLSILHTT